MNRPPRNGIRAFDPECGGAERHAQRPLGSGGETNQPAAYLGGGMAVAWNAATCGPPGDSIWWLRVFSNARRNSVGNFRLGRPSVITTTLWPLRPEIWRWCSAGWFEQSASSAFRRLLDGVQTDRVHLADAFEPVAPDEEEGKAASSRRTPQVSATS